MGDQSTYCCVVAGACMMKENETMASVLFRHYARTMLAIAEHGIPANDDEPALSPQKFMTGTGDLAYRQKVSGNIGGGCKAKHDFYTHCACTSAEHDLLSFVTGDLRCDRCIRNLRSTCAHRDVNDKKELRRKGMKLLDLLLEDFARKHNRIVAEISYHHMMPT